MRANFDARLTTPLNNQGLINGVLEAPFSASPESPILPADLTHSIAYYRPNRTGTSQMPPLAKNVVDSTAMNVLANWINSLATGPGVRLLAPAQTTGQFAISVTFTQAVTGLSASYFYITNGSIASLTGSGASYTLNVTPSGDGDGVSNFTEFAFGGNPLAPDTVPLTVTSAGGGAFTLQFRARDSASSLTYTVLTSQDLAAWAPVDTRLGNIRTTPISSTSYHWVFGDYTPLAGETGLPTFFCVTGGNAP